MSYADTVLKQINTQTFPHAGDFSGNEQKLLDIRSCRQCIEDAKLMPIPKSLFSAFWMEGEICILFADTNIGKSILAVQIANSISKGEAITGFELQAPKQDVLYFDFELSDKQFEQRYSKEFENHYPFDEGLYRIRINPDCYDFDNFEERLYLEIQQAILQTGSKVLIIDNITYLNVQSQETSKEAAPLMKKLKQLKQKYNLSILVLAHTPKRNQSNPITVNDLAGSKMLSNFSDSMFCIGQSFKHKEIRYLKQVKIRNGAAVFDSENIALCIISKWFNYVQFELEGYGIERDHLKPMSVSQQSELDQSILALRQSEPNISIGEIARKLNTNKMKVKRVLDKSDQNSSSS